MGKASVPKRGRGVKTRPLRSDAQTKGMPSIALGKGSHKKKLKPVTVKKGKVKLKPTKAKPKAKPEAKPAIDEDSDTASVASARVRRGAPPESEASTSKSPNEADVKGSKRQKPMKALSERSESPATTRLSRSSSANSFAGKNSEVKKTGKAAVEKGKAKSPESTPTNKILNYFTRKGSPSSKGPTESNTKKTISSLKKESETTGSTNKKGTASTDSSPDSVNSGSNKSNQVVSERPEINDDDLSTLDDAESFVGSDDLDAPSALNGVGGLGTKAIPKLTRKNINELFPSDESTNRLRSGSPASQKSTRSLTLQRNSPKSASVSSLRSTTMSDSAVRFLRNGQQNKFKRSSLFETASKKKKRVYAGALKDEDKIEDSRSDFSDEQSSIFSESDSSSFIDTSSRLKNTDLDKMDVEDVPESMSNDEDDVAMEQMDSPTQKNFNTVTSAMASGEVQDNCQEPSEPAEKDAQQPPKNMEILNNIQSDWDSDGEGNSHQRNTSEPESPKEGNSAFRELLTGNTLPQLKDQLSCSEANSLKNFDTNDVSSSDPKKSEEKQESDVVVAVPLVFPKSVSQPDPDLDKPSTNQTEFSPIKSKLPEPIVIRTAESKNTFNESVEFVAKRHSKNSKIDFELLRRRTKRSMSFNTDAQEISQNQRILAVEPNKVHGKPALVWAVTAVRDPIIPKSTKSSEKKLTKSDPQESRNISPVKPMMESTQNDLTTAIPKVSPDALLTSSQFSVSSSSVKENIMIQTSLKQNAGKSPVRESVVSGSSPKSATICSTKEARSDNSINGDVDLDKPTNGILKDCSEPTVSNLEDGPINQPAEPTASSLEDNPTKQPSEVPATPIEEAALKSNLLSPATASLTPSDDLSIETHVATALEAPEKESSAEEDPAMSGLATDEAETTERSDTPDSSLPALQKHAEVTPDKVGFDDESFSLRLSPTPTKEDSCQVRGATMSSSKSDSSLKNKDTSPIQLIASSADKEGENDSTDLATRLPDDTGKPEEILVQNADLPAKTESHSLQLIIKKGAGRPRSLSADCNSSATSCVDDVWVVKNGESSSLETPAEEDKSSPSDEEKKEMEVKEEMAGKCQNLHLEIVSSSANQGESSEADSSPLKANEVKNDSSSDLIAINVKQPGLLSPRLEAEVERRNFALNDIEKKRREITEEEQSPEKKAIKEWILNSLGLQSVTAAAAAAASGTGRPTKRRSQDGLLPSSGRLKAVIKVPKDSKRDKKSDRKPLRMVFKNGKPHPGGSEDGPALGRNLECDITPQIEVKHLV